MDEKIIITLSENICTNFSGIKKLFDFYNRASEHYNKIIYLDFYRLNWFDANLSALFGSIIKKLEKENNLRFSTDYEFLKEHFDVLFRNGLFNNGIKVDDKQRSTISYKSFSPIDKEGFIDYIENDLLKHRGMPELTEEEEENIFDSLIEVFSNIQIHSKSNDDFYVCGQLFPSDKTLVFSIVDIGIGFLPAIKQKTRNKINNNYDAIKWALKESNTTKNSPGGLGLYDLNSYFNRTKGNLQIITGDTFWSTELENAVIKKFTFPNPYVGSILNLFFKYN